MEGRDPSPGERAGAAVNKPTLLFPCMPEQKGTWVHDTPLA